MKCYRCWMKALYCTSTRGKWLSHKLVIKFEVKENKTWHDHISDKYCVEGQGIVSE